MLRVTVIAHPSARTERLKLLDDGTLGAWICARPVEGQANVAIERVVAAALGLRPRQVKIVSGLTNRRKILESVKGQVVVESPPMAEAAFKVYNLTDGVTYGPVKSRRLGSSLKMHLIFIFNSRSRKTVTRRLSWLH